MKYLLSLIVVLAALGVYFCVERLECRCQIMQLVLAADIKVSDSTNEKMNKLVKVIRNNYECEDNGFWRRAFSRGYISVLHTGHGNCIELTELLEMMSKAAKVDSFVIEKVYINRDNEVITENYRAKHCALGVGLNVYDVSMEYAGEGLSLNHGRTAWRYRYDRLCRLNELALKK